MSEKDKANLLAILEACEKRHKHWTESSAYVCTKVHFIFSHIDFHQLKN